MKKNKYALLIVSVCFIAFIAGIGAYNDTSLYWYFPKDVGIYTTSPGAELHVAGTTPEVRIGDDDAEDTALIFMGNAKDMYIALDDTTDDLTVGEGTTIGSNVRMVIENGGNVGIGTITPSGELSIASSGTNSITSLYVETYNDQAAFNPEINLGKSHSDTLGTLTTTIDTEVLGNINFYGVDSGSNQDTGARIQAKQNGAAGTKIPTDLVFKTSSSSSLSDALTLGNNNQATFTGSIVASAANHAFGVASTSDHVGVRINNSVVSGGSASKICLGVDIDPSLTLDANDTNYAAKLGVYGGTITVPDGTNVGVLAGIRVGDPLISLTGSASVDEAASLYVRAAPTEGTVNAALLVKEGDTLLSVNSGNVGINGITSPAEELEVGGEALFETAVYSDTNDITLSVSQCRNTFWSNSGASDAQTFTLPAAAAGYQVTFCCVTAQDIHIDPDDSDQILPTCNSTGDRLSSDASQGSTVTLLAVDSTNWFIINSIGTWSDIN